MSQRILRSQADEGSDPLMLIFGSGRLSSQGSQPSLPGTQPLKKVTHDSMEEGAGTQPLKKVTHDSMADRPGTQPLKKVTHDSMEEGAGTQPLKKVTHDSMADRPGTQPLKKVTHDSIMEDGAGSQSLFSSQSSQGSRINEQIDLTLQLTEFVWVQCDNHNCQKWRKIPANVADNLSDEPWYCHMNPDPSMVYCSVPEEDYARYDRMAKKAGIKYIMSMLNMGSLVWAKMPGYCRWPALITRDPACGIHVMIDLDGDPHSYHVEFLGNPHSHSWVTARQVEVYGHKDLPEIQGSQSQASQPTRALRGGRGRGRGRGTCFQKLSTRQLRRSYKRIHIADVVEEADFFMGMSPEDRLQYTVFKYDPYTQAETQETVKKRRKSCDKCGQHKQKKGRPSGKSTGPALSQQSGGSNSRVKTKAGTQSKDMKVKRKTVKKGKENQCTDMYEYTSDHSSLRGNLPSVDEGISVPTIRSEASLGFDSPDQFSQSKLCFKSSLVDKSKEEKFTIDINMYKKNEKAFEHDVHRFMSRNGVRIKASPVWSNVPVGLFQLYLAVHERGGFLQVTTRKQWSSVYKELTESFVKSGGSMAKKFYKRNLYPYELYITGKEYQHSLSSTHNRKPTTTRTSDNKRPTSDKHWSSSKPLADKTNQPSQEAGQVEKRSAVRKHVDRYEDDEVSLTEDIEAILGQLQEEFQSQSSQQKDKLPGLGLGIKFYDESTPRFQDEKVPSEFAPPSFTESSSAPQMVPDIALSDSLTEVESKILHEMKALEDDIKQLDEEEDTL